MIKSALAVMPTRPVVYIVPIVVVVVMSIYYWNLYTDCTHDKQFRASLNELLHSMHSSEQFRLTDVTDFAWDKVRIIDDYKPENKIADCPFGWDWSAAERESLIASNLLSILIFGYEGIIVEHLELRSDQVVFNGADISLTPDSALFDIGKNAVNSSSVALTLMK
jgi:hypothetical protein